MIMRPRAGWPGLGARLGTFPHVRIPDGLRGPEESGKIMAMFALSFECIDRPVLGLALITQSRLLLGPKAYQPTNCVM